MTFREVMEEALYGEGGYYNRPDPAIGKAGDFVTGSSVSSLFGRSTARLLERLDESLEQPASLLEAGYGDGRHLRAVLEGLSAGSRTVLGWDRIERPLPAGATALRSLEDLSEPVTGLVFSYELFDALPIHRLIGREDGQLHELWVDVEPGGSLTWKEGELSEPGLKRLLGGVTLESGQIADLAPDWGPLYTRLARALERGLLVTCDYGYERHLLLEPRIRRFGTLACHRAHRVHRDALAELGEQDLTAHVDFTALREAGEAEGLETIALTRQARWLAALGIFDDLADASLELRSEAATLLDGDGMGDQIRVLVQGRGIDASAVLDQSLLGDLPAHGP
jgi:SAM-dependent MidA family methyltransferase